VIVKDGVVIDVVRGLEDEIHFTDEQAKKMLGATTIHNRRYDTSFSPDDVQGAVTRGEKESRVISPVAV